MIFSFDYNILKILNNMAVYIYIYQFKMVLVNAMTIPDEVQ